MLQRNRSVRVSGDESGDDMTRTDADDRACVDRIRAGDVNAFESLYRAWWQPLYAFAFRYVQTKEEAEEVVQDVFARIWRGRENWRPPGAVRNYLYLAVRNSALDRLRRSDVARRWRAGEAATGRVEAPDIEQQIESSDLMAGIERALGELPSRRRAVCILRFIDGLSYAQIADRLGIAEKTVETQISRSLKFLRERFRSG